MLSQFQVLILVNTTKTSTLTDSVKLLLTSVEEEIGQC